MMSLAGIVFSSMVIFSILTTGQTPQNHNHDALTGSVRSIPVRLKIPKINVDAVIESTGLTPDGAMGVPKNPADAAWFDSGSRPGEIGNAVIAGHEGWKDGVPAVFDDLRELSKGDKIYVYNEGGMTTVFAVSGVKIYGENDDASNVFVSNDGKAHLNLITCEGIWNKARKSYSDRLVVFADISSTGVDVMNPY